MRKLIRRPVRFKGLTVGLDVHKAFIEHCIMDQQGDQQEGGRVDSSREGLSKLLSLVGDRPAQYVLESGGSSMWVFDHLVAHAHRELVHVVQPHRIWPIAHSLEKNDARDAWWLAYLQFEGRLPEAFVPEDQLRDLRISTRELRQAVDQRSDLIRRFKSHLAQEGLPLSGKNFHSRAARAEAAELTQSCSGGRGWALDHLLSRIDRLDEEVDWWRARVEELSQLFPPIQIMQEAIPGIGPITAAIIFGELGDPVRYRSAKAFARAGGVIPGYRESGGKRVPTGVRGGGNPHVRWALTRAAIACTRCRKGPGAKVKGWLLRQQKRHAKKKVYVAVGRKLAEGIWRLFHLGEEFDLGKAFPGGPTA